MTTYLDSLTDKAFVPNIVVRMLNEYYSIRQPDSGLVVDSDKVGVVTSVTVNPTSIDPFRATSTTSSYSVSLLDRLGSVSALFANRDGYFQGLEVEIWVGRVSVDMAFADYLKLPNTFVSRVSKQDSRYTFTTREQRDRLATGAFQVQSKLAAAMTVGTTTITVTDASGLPASGTIAVDREFVSYAAKAGNNLTGCVRGEEGSTPVEHGLGTSVYLVEEIEANPIEILLQLLISSGGGGTYDVLSDGAAIDQSLVDIDQMETIRDEFFSGQTYRFLVYNLSSLKQLIEEEICFPLGVRLRANSNAKIGLALLNRAFLEIDNPVLNHNNVTKQPDFDVDDTKINNRLRIFWDWDDASGEYLEVTETTDTDSITEFGAKTWFEMRFKGVRESLGGAGIVADISLLFLSRFAFPRPNISVSTHLDGSYLNLGDKPELYTTYLPNDAGELNFGSSVEVVSKSINFQTGDCRFQLAFTSFTGVRTCYIAPSDLVDTVNSQSSVDIGAGRGVNWRAGWKVRLYDDTARDEDAGAQLNTIDTVTGDVLTFVDPWATTLIAAQHRIMFGDYDEVVAQQQRFCFMSDGTNDFADGTSPYQVSFG